MKIKIKKIVKLSKYLISILILTIIIGTSVRADAYVNIRSWDSSYNPVFYNNTLSGSTNSVSSLVEEQTVSSTHGVTSGNIINGPVNIHVNPHIYSNSTYTESVCFEISTYGTFTITATAYYTDNSSLQFSVNYDGYPSTTFTGKSGYIGQKNIVLPATNNNYPMSSWKIDARIYRANVTCYWYTPHDVTNLTFELNAWYEYVEAGNFADQDTVAAAKSSADAAKSSADTAASRAQTAINQTIDTGTSAASWAHQSYDKANTAANNTTYSGQSAGYWAYLASSADTTPPTITKVSGQGGATCTTTTTFNVDITAIDNKAGQLQAQIKVDSGAWSSWSNLSIAATLSTAGAHTITINVKDAAGNISSATMTAFKI